MYPQINVGLEEIQSIKRAVWFKSQFTKCSIPVVQYGASAVQTKGELNDDEPSRCFNIETICRNQHCTRRHVQSLNTPTFQP